MSHWCLTLIGVFILVLPLTAIQAEDISHGEKLHQENCLKCHTSNLYEKADRKIKNLKHLGSQVLFCAVSNDVDWFDEEVESVTAYLNAFYYLFDIK